MKSIGFDNDRYLQEQSQFIRERAATFDNKLYLEFGGKLVHDFHASRILPGFHPNVKVSLLERLNKLSVLFLPHGRVHKSTVSRKRVSCISLHMDLDNMLDLRRQFPLNLESALE